MTLDSAVQHLLKAKRISNTTQSYAKDNPAEWAKVKTYLEGGTRPSGVVTEMGLGLLEVEDERRGAPPPPPPPPPPPDPDPLPTTITSGGTYSGTATQTVNVRTNQPVMIDQSSVTVSGTADIVNADYSGAQVTIQRSLLKGGSGRVLGANFKSFTVQNCNLESLWGIRLDNGQAGCTILVTRNKFRNIISSSNPSGLSHAFQAAWTTNPSSAEVSWNEVVNILGQSGCEDVFSSYASSNVKFHDNFIDGAYPAVVGAGYSGGGIIVDGQNGHDNEAFDNIVLNTVNYGVAIAGGMNNRFYRNRAVFDGKNDAGQLFAAANIGAYVADFSNQGSSMTGNEMFDNVIGWTNSSGARNDAWLPKCQGRCNNQSLKSGTISKADEDAERARWQAKLAAAGVTIGV